jgi:hypothetical protein
MSATAFAAVRISRKSITIAVNAPRWLHVDGTKKKVTWKSTNTKVVTVKQTGTITGKKAGKATVVARVAGKSYKCAVTVLSNKQIENRVYSRVHKYYGNLTRLGCYRRGTTLEVEIGRPRGEGAIVITYKVNLKTGKAVADYYTWREFFRKAPRTFTVF